MIDSFEKSRKGSANTVITSAITATSDEYNIAGYNAILLSAKITSAATWKLDVKGRFDTNGTVMDMYDNNASQLTTGNITANRTQLFVALPDLITISATLVDGTATLTARMQPINI